tara:strand:- start:3 stop:1106 length:1104 start_codon:yes stop_codon:yes gene_type:complete
MFPSRHATLGGDVFRDEYSLSFDGTNDYIDCGNDSSIQVGTSDFSICAWIKKAADGNDAIIIAHGRDTDPRWFFRLDGSNKLEMWSDDGTGTSLISVSTITGTGWNHVALSWDRDSATGAKLYINGILDAERDGTAEQSTLTNSSYGTLIGARRTTGSTIAQYWNGKISDIALYTEIALTASQIKTIYNGREPYNHKEGIASNNLAGWWRMGDGALDGFNLIGDEVDATLGSDLVTNGGFDTDSDWTKGTDWSIDTTDGVAKGDSTTDNLIQSDIVEVGKHYKITYTIKDYVAGSVRVELSTDTSAGVTRSSNGTFTETLKANSTYIAFDARTSFTGSIDNVKVYEVNGNSGIMTNMASDDFTGDTP